MSAYKSGGYTLKDIGEYFGLHYSRVSSVVARLDPNDVWLLFNANDIYGRSNSVQQFGD